MKTIAAPPRRPSQGFTIVEIVGALAVLSVLASLFLPRVFAVFAEARITYAAASYHSMRSGVGEYYENHAKFGGPGGTDLALPPGGIYEDWDSRCLVADGYANHPFDAAIGNGNNGSASNGARLRIINISANTSQSLPAGEPADLDSGAYDLDGRNDANDAHGFLLVEACIEGVANRDAVELNNRIDGASLGAAYGANDAVGRVKYVLDANGTAKVRIYVAHR